MAALPRAFSGTGWRWPDSGHLGGTGFPGLPLTVASNRCLCHSELTLPPPGGQGLALGRLADTVGGGRLPCTRPLTRTPSPNFRPTPVQDGGMLRSSSDDICTDPISKRLRGHVFLGPSSPLQGRH